MFCDIQNLEVFDSIVSLNLVSMMYLFFSFELTPQVLLHDKSMFIDVTIAFACSVWIYNHHVTLLIDPSTSIKVRIRFCESTFHSINDSRRVPLHVLRYSSCVMMFANTDYLATTTLAQMLSLLFRNPIL
jgi:hypothetical protein